MTILPTSTKTLVIPHLGGRRKSILCLDPTGQKEARLTQPLKQEERGCALAYQSVTGMSFSPSLPCEQTANVRPEPDSEVELEPGGGGVPCKLSLSENWTTSNGLLDRRIKMKGINHQSKYQKERRSHFGLIENSTGVLANEWVK